MAHIQASSLEVEAQNSLKKVDIIWNITLVCPWDCEICCVDAVHVSRQNGNVRIRSHSLTRTEHLAYNKQEGTAFDQAMKLRQNRGDELNLAGKMHILENLDGFIPKLDFSGGDPMSATENLEVMRIASKRFGREQITLTATGAGLARCIPEQIVPLIGELNFTYDSPYPEGSENRPAGYASGNLKKAALFAAAGVHTRAECPLTRQNIADEDLRQLYINLHEAKIEKLLLMRLFPVGRGIFRSAAVPTPSQYRHAIQIFRELESQLGYPKVKPQCALKFFDRQDMIENPCDLVHESFGLMADGTLLASPWAVGSQGKPLHDAWVLGNLAQSQLSEILASEKAKMYQVHLDDNFGQCKIFAFFNSNKPSPLERIFDRTDPLYVNGD